MEQFKIGDEVYVSPKSTWHKDRIGVINKIYKDDGSGLTHMVGNLWVNAKYLYRSKSDYKKSINSNQTNMDELKITKQRVLDAAARCGTAKATLELLFPEAFQKNMGTITKVRVDRHYVVVEEETGDTILNGSAHSDKGFWLDPTFNYEINNDHLRITRK